MQGKQEHLLSNQSLHNQKILEVTGTYCILFQGASPNFLKVFPLIGEELK